MSSNTKLLKKKEKKKKKKANFINNQLEIFFSFSFSLVLKQYTFMTFPNQNPKHPKTQSESQPSQNP